MHRIASSLCYSLPPEAYTREEPSSLSTHAHNSQSTLPRCPPAQDTTHTNPPRSSNPTKQRSTSLTLLTLALADLGRETRLDSRDRAAGPARVAGDEVETVLALVELGVGRAAGLAGDVFHWGLLAPYWIYGMVKKGDLLIYRRSTFSICFCWKRPLITSRFDPSTEPLVPSSAKR